MGALGAAALVAQPGWLCSSDSRIRALHRLCLVPAHVCQGCHHMGTLTLSRVIQAPAASPHWHPPGTPASSLSMGFN